jgi:membrane peptidoglycan carboxypeptidase
MAEAARTGTASTLGRQFRGPVAAKTGTDDEGRQFGLVAFTGRWLVYLSFWTDRPRQVRSPRAGASLAPAMAQLLVNLHLDAPRGPLRCAPAEAAPGRLAAR